MVIIVKKTDILFNKIIIVLQSQKIISLHWLRRRFTTERSWVQILAPDTRQKVRKMAMEKNKGSQIGQNKKDFFEETWVCFLTPCVHMLLKRFRYLKINVEIKAELNLLHHCFLLFDTSLSNCRNSNCNRNAVGRRCRRRSRRRSTCNLKSLSVLY